MSLDPGSDAARNPHGYGVAEWSATYDQPHHLYPGPPAEIPRRSLVYLSGPPGVGKSTLMAELTAHCTREPFTSTVSRDVLTLPDPARVRLPMHSAVELGKRRDSFSGTDALPMNVVVNAEQYMARGARAHSLVLAEGDRLANYRFLTGSRAAGWAVTLIHLDAPLAVQDARCAARGTTQNPIWRAGRITKSRRLAETMTQEGIPVVMLDGRNDVPCLLMSVLEAVPVLAALQPVEVPA